MALVATLAATVACCGLGFAGVHPGTRSLVHLGLAGCALLAAAQPGAVLARAHELAKAGEAQLALHVVDLLALAPGDEPEVVDARQLKAELCTLLAEESSSFVSQSLYLSSAGVIRDEPKKHTGIR